MLNYTVKDYKIGGYYHLRLQSCCRQVLFADGDDVAAFERLLRGCLMGTEDCDCPCLSDDVSLVGCCLDSHHCHFLLHLHWMNGANDLLSFIQDEYASYYYEKYGYGQPLWDKKLKAVELQAPGEVVHVLDHIRHHSRVSEGAHLEMDSLDDLPMLRAHAAVQNAGGASTALDAPVRPSSYLDYICIDVLPQSKPAADTAESVI